jgi:hypothetical protein
MGSSFDGGKNVLFLVFRLNRAEAWAAGGGGVGLGGGGGGGGWGWWVGGWGGGPGPIYQAETDPVGQTRTCE